MSVRETHAKNPHTQLHMYIKHTISEVIYYVIFLPPGLFLLTAIHNETKEHMCAPHNACMTCECTQGQDVHIQVVLPLWFLNSLSFLAFHVFHEEAKWT